MVFQLDQTPEEPNELSHSVGAQPPLPWMGGGEAATTATAGSTPASRDEVVLDKIWLSFLARLAVRKGFRRARRAGAVTVGPLQSLWRFSGLLGSKRTGIASMPVMKLDARWARGSRVASSRSGSRRVNSSNMILSSRRARLAPRQ